MGYKDGPLLPLMIRVKTVIVGSPSTALSLEGEPTISAIISAEIHWVAILQHGRDVRLWPYREP
jgi:hypothetical protein